MSGLSVLEASVQLASAIDRATDHVVHQEIANIVKLHAKLSLATIFIPIPGADLAAAAANTWTMYARINKALGIPFSEQMLKSLAAGVASNILSNIPMLGVASIFKAFPGIGTIAGTVILGASIYTVTIAAGIVYMKALAALLKQKSELTDVNLKAAADSLVNDKAALREIISEADKEYQTAKASGELNTP